MAPFFGGGEDDKPAFASTPAFTFLATFITSLGTKKMLSIKYIFTNIKFARTNNEPSISQTSIAYRIVFLRPAEFD